MNINKYGINNMYLKQTFLMIALGAMAMTAAAQASIDTQRQYLSGHGCDDMVRYNVFRSWSSP